MYKYNASAKFGNICFIWKVPEETDQVRQHQTVGEVEKLLPMFETRLEAKYLREKYENIATVSPILRCNIVEFLMEKSTTVSLNLRLHFFYVRVSVYKIGSSCIIN